ncbi:hypothetical protein E4U34_006301 [Claviceps purpurea]|nr:hypothetical protein E4U11_005844 [Claviceps purpurea]KAG6169538.1 hypothetical protein E4U51_001510 [Claviceps purpurea]KAG6227054.1 hypothetical protein E4U34_006301 [Claviceps purpurea]
MAGESASCYGKEVPQAGGVVAQVALQRCNPIIRFRSSVERVALSQNGTPSIGWQGWDWDGISTLHKRAELSQWLGLSAPTVNSNVGY